jgi:hypothetical protein
MLFGRNPRVFRVKEKAHPVVHRPSDALQIACRPGIIIAALKTLLCP